MLPSVQITVAGLLVAVAVLSWWYLWGRRGEVIRLLWRERTAILVAEAIFLALFFGWVIYRAYDPSISHTEKPMDFAFLNASVRSDYGAPEDPWLRGSSISYYYFGYWMMGTLTKLTGITPSISYNLSLALIPAMAAMGMFGLVYSLVRADTNRLRYAVAGGIVAALLLTVVANLEGRPSSSCGPTAWARRGSGTGSGSTAWTGPAPAVTESWRPQEFWWWWHATRVISTSEGGQLLDYTIQEFPFFSFMLGDLHPHVMALPFVILFLAVCWNLFRSPLHIWREPSVRAYATILAIGLSLGGLGFTNMWDLPVFAALLLGTVALKTYTVRGGSVWGLAKGTVPFGAMAVGIALLLFLLPYYLDFTSQVSGIAPVTGPTTRPIHMLLVWALFLVAVIPFILGVFWRTTLKEDWARLSLFSMVIGFLPIRGVGLLVC